MLTDPYWIERKKERHKYATRQWRYGIRREEFEQMVASRGGKCDLCHELPRGKRKTLVVDHDHFTGRIRGLLCNDCNLGLGRLGDDASVPLKIQQYLQSPPLPDFKQQQQEKKHEKKMYKDVIKELEEEFIKENLYQWVESFF